MLYVDDLLIASNDVVLLHNAKRFLKRNFKKKDLDDASFVLGIEILRDCSQGIFILSQKNYIKKKLVDST